MYIYIPLELIQILLCTKECFTIPNYNLFVNYIWCLLVVEGRKTTRNIYRYCFFCNKNLVSWERLLSQYKWSLPQVMEKLFCLLIKAYPEQFLIYGTYTVAYDSSLIAKNSTKIPGVQTGVSPYILPLIYVLLPMNDIVAAELEAAVDKKIEITGILQNEMDI